ncbi:Fe-S cluster assembly protein SufD [Tahibacter amnicola]|uniref:Fe-S cluster assembly protein SufD n=1 Tax=Tahibacter amnicola TaxID=2976241 RepID=A0ABY6BD75_9GAMM|nr:Fe-S cluster assembly protein SufD [Tahibacter amnicola]UXI67168.1 Fe-S cluster assembly protein SufD [Tahibacter amnicola]
MSVPLLEGFRDSFERLPPALAGDDRLLAARRAQLDAALSGGLPGARAERWRYMPMRALERRRFESVDAPATVDAALLPDLPGPRLVFVNGHFDAALSRLENLPEGVTLQPLSTLLAGGEPRAFAHLQRTFEAADETFARLNAALATEGGVIRVASGVQCSEPVQLVLVGTANAADRATHLRHLVELGDGARLQLVEYRTGVAAHTGFINDLVQIHLQRGAALEHIRVQAEDSGASVLCRSDAVLAGETDYRRTDLELGAALSRHELNVALQGRGAAFQSHGVLLADGRRHVETRLEIDHVAPETRCDLFWRGMGADRGRGVFHGGILIRAGADGTSAHLSNKNLLLSANAEINTQPVLEIHADEVQASHGATVGQLDERALFYLRSRGLDEAQARAMLTMAFCRVALGAVKTVGLREHLDALLNRRVPGATEQGAAA